MPKILIVDDEPDMVKGLQFNLEARGYDVVTAADGEAGLAAVAQVKPDLVLLDVMMPSIRGDKLATLLRKSPALARLGVVLISSLPETELAPLMAEVEVDAFVSKANLRSELAAVIRSVAARA